MSSKQTVVGLHGCKTLALRTPTVKFIQMKTVQVPAG